MIGDTDIVLKTSGRLEIEVELLADDGITPVDSLGHLRELCVQKLRGVMAALGGLQYFQELSASNEGTWVSCLFTFVNFD
jgi:hypothetical protein